MEKEGMVNSKASRSSNTLAGRNAEKMQPTRPSSESGVQELNKDLDSSSNRSNTINNSLPLKLYSDNNTPRGGESVTVERKHHIFLCSTRTSGKDECLTKTKTR